jgi:aryl-alcohol dehydrogenase-like predicted oxidoreductase
MTMTRTLGRSGRMVSALGFGCWAIGGTWQSNGQPAGWGQVDDQESMAAIRRAVDLGVSLFDTADVYGCGHSERVLGQALAGVRDQVVGRHQVRPGLRRAAPDQQRRGRQPRLHPPGL